MIPWPFLFCQKPIVSAPVFVPQIVTEDDDVWSEMAAVLSYSTHLPGVTVMLREYLNTPAVHVIVSPPSVAAVVLAVQMLAVVASSTPNSTCGPLLNVSYTFCGLPSTVVGVVKSTPAVPEA